METTVKSYVYDITKLKDSVIDTIENIEKWVKEKDYRFKDDVDHFKLILQSTESLFNLSKNQKKKINNYIFSLQKKISLKRVNLFFNLLNNYMKNTDTTSAIRVLISEKEEKIQKYRKERIKANLETERLLELYKEEKVNFYKK
jgi:transcriptional regulator of heat shock response